MSKGSKRRPSAVDIDANWARTFGDRAVNSDSRGDASRQYAPEGVQGQNGGRGPETDDWHKSSFTPELWEPYERAMARGLMDKANRELREMFYGKDEPISPTEGA